MTTTIYTDADLGKHLDLIITATLMARADAATAGDIGTSVLCAGIAISYKAPRARQPSRRVIVSAVPQGNISARRSCERAMEFLSAKGLEVTWFDGHMD